MKRFSTFFIFGLITGLRLLPWPADDVSAAATAAVTARDTCDPKSSMTAGRCGTSGGDRPASDTSVGPKSRRRRRRDRYRPKAGLRATENVVLYIMGLVYDQLELVLYLTLYKIRFLYTALVEPVFVAVSNVFKS